MRKAAYETSGLEGKFGHDDPFELGVHQADEYYWEKRHKQHALGLLLHKLALERFQPIFDDLQLALIYFLLR